MVELIIITIYTGVASGKEQTIYAPPKCSVQSWHRMPSMSNTFLAVFRRPIANHCCRICWATYCPKSQCQHRMMIQKSAKAIMAPEEESNLQTPHLYCISCAYILHENAPTSDEICHLWHRSTLVELLATRMCSVLLLLL